MCVMPLFPAGLTPLRRKVAIACPRRGPLGGGGGAFFEGRILLKALLSDSTKAEHVFLVRQESVSHRSPHF